MITWRMRTMILISMKNKMRVMMKMRKKTLINISDMLVLVDWKVILLRLKSLKRKILHLLLIIWLKNRSHLIGNLEEL